MSRGQKRSWTRKQREQRNAGPNDYYAFLKGVCGNEPHLATLERNVDTIADAATANAERISEGRYADVELQSAERNPYSPIQYPVRYDQALRMFVPQNLESHPHLVFGKNAYTGLTAVDVRKRALWGILPSFSTQSIEDAKADGYEHVEGVLHTVNEADHETAAYNHSLQQIWRYAQLRGHSEEVWQKGMPVGAYLGKREFPDRLTQEEEQERAREKGYFFERMCFSILMQIGPYLRPKLQLHIGDYHMDRMSLDGIIAIPEYDCAFGFDVKHRHEYHTKEHTTHLRKTKKRNILKQRFGLEDVYPARGYIQDIETLISRWEACRTEGILITPDDMLPKAELIETIMSLLAGVRYEQEGKYTYVYSREEIERVVDLVYHREPIEQFNVAA